MKSVNIAIDGPSGAGKSTLARQLAARLGFLYVDTGAMYRAIAYDCMRCHAKTEEEILAHLPSISVALEYIDGTQHVFVNDDDVSAEIRTAEVSMEASRVAAIPAVRAFLLSLQQKLAKERSLVMDGRDIGTVVLPDADIKIFLTASAEKRAERRYAELCEKQPGKQSYEEVLADVIRRDEQDMNRKIAPLKQAPDAVLVDTTNADLAESLEMLLAACKEKLDL